MYSPSSLYIAASLSSPIVADVDITTTTTPRTSQSVDEPEDLLARVGAAREQPLVRRVPREHESPIIIIIIFVSIVRRLPPYVR